MAFFETCEICGRNRIDYDDGFTISRCCCDSDWLCLDCLTTKTLADYAAAIGWVSPLVKD